MIDKKELIEKFALNFVQRHKRERCVFSLNSKKRRDEFINKLNHGWDSVMNMDRLTKIDKLNDYSEKIQSIMGVHGKDQCYVISGFSELDNQVVNFKTAIEDIHGSGSAGIIINEDASIIYLETEQEQGPPDRFIGRTK